MTAINLARKKIASRTPRLTTVLAVNATGSIANIGPEHSDHDGWLARLENLFGSSGRDFPISQLNHLLALTRTSDGKYDNVRANALMAAVEGASPTNEVQASLAVQMVITHELAMQAMLRSARVDQIPQYDSAGSMAVKLLRTYTLLAETLAKLQRGGEQIVKVVHIHPGAQAIVGNVTTGASSAAQGGGVSFENESQPHAKGELPAPGAAPMPQVWSQDTQRGPLLLARGKGPEPMPDARRGKR